MKQTFFRGYSNGPNVLLHFSLILMAGMLAHHSLIFLAKLGNINQTAS